jgi:hypothetical protein
MSGGMRDFDTTLVRLAAPNQYKPTDIAWLLLAGVFN